MSDDILTHPVQAPNKREQSRCPVVVSMLAYEVYCRLYGPQIALVTGDCRGGMSCGELIAFLYARNFPQSEWRARVDEAFNGMKNL